MLYSDIFFGRIPHFHTAHTRWFCVSTQCKNLGIFFEGRCWDTEQGWKCDFINGSIGMTKGTGLGRGILEYCFMDKSKVKVIFKGIFLL